MLFSKFSRKSEPVESPPEPPEADAQILQIEKKIGHTLKSIKIEHISPTQKDKIVHYFAENPECSIKIYEEDDNFVVRIYPVGRLRRLADEKASEVAAKGYQTELPPMGSYERFIIHEHLKDREEITTHSVGISGQNRRVVIVPRFGRKPRKVTKRRLMR